MTRTWPFGDSWTEGSRLECCGSREPDWRIAGSPPGEGHDGSGRGGGTSRAAGSSVSVRCRVRSGGGYGTRRGGSEFAEVVETFWSALCQSIQSRNSRIRGEFKKQRNEFFYLTEVLDGALEGMESNIHFIMRPQIRHILSGVSDEACRDPAIRSCGRERNVGLQNRYCNAHRSRLKLAMV